MIRTFTATLVADGSSDRALKPILELLFNKHCPVPFRIHFAQGFSTSASLAVRVQQAIYDFPCELLLVHRDAEGVEPNQREHEIQSALASLEDVPTAVCVVPVRMTEAWLLMDERAIRAAVGNPNGTESLQLPPKNRVEKVDAKDALMKAIQAASGLGQRRLRRFAPDHFRHRVAELLRGLPSFCKLETTLAEQLQQSA
jgi:hypothetical protein